MTRPLKRSDSSFLSYRKRVPDDLRAIIGKSEIKISLRTRDPVEAKIAHAKVAAEVEARWAQLRRGVISVSQKQAVAMAGEIYRELVAAHEENPGEAREWGAKLNLDWAFLRPEKVRVFVMGTKPEKSEQMFEKLRLDRHGQIVQAFLDRKGYRVDNESLIRIKTAANAAIMQGREQLLRNAEGDYRPDPDAGRFPELELSNEPSGNGGIPAGQASPLDVFDRYSKESKLSAATIKRWRPIVAKVQKEHPTISGITPEWCIGWKNRLVESGLSNNGIRNAYLASMRSLCNWAVSNREMTSNPFKDVTVKADKKKQMRQKGLLDSEARLILAATLEPAPDTFTSQHAAARRWVPWLCAYC